MSRVTLAVAVTVTAMVCGGGGVILAAVAAAGYVAGKAPTPGVATRASMQCGVPTTTIQSVSVTRTPAGYTPTQVQNATVIVRAGQSAGVPPRGWIVAVATAMQESNLHNEANPRVPESMALPHEGSGTDHDSVGLFQQRPSWGATADLMDPARSAGKFYAALLKAPNWQSLPLTIAAQRVQRSAFPSAYAKHEKPASVLVDAITGGASNAVLVSGKCADPGQVTAGGWVQPVVAQIGSPYGPRGGRLHAGVDLMAPKRTAIRSAADGTVVEAHCDASTSAVWSCDRDGKVVNGAGVTPGCGWMVDVRHAGGVETRYCHMVVEPLVHVGDHVAAGQQLGWSGSSGSSSGPHVHFEVHVGLGPGDRAGNSNSTDPVPFMRDHGAALGTGGTA